MVIPALDEAEGVGRAVASAREAGEVVVVDGGSRDETVRVASQAGARVITSEPGRGRQIVAGAAATSGDWIVVLHADTVLEEGFVAALRSLPDDVVGGAFRLAIEEGGLGYRIVEAGVRLRCRWLDLPYGDQAIFARRGAYDAAGGMAPLPLMEDVAFVRALRRQGRLAHLPLRAVTSARRWQRHGIVGTTARNWVTLLAYSLGASPERLARAYRRS